MSTLTYRTYRGPALIHEIAEYRVTVCPDYDEHPEAYEPVGPWPGTPKPTGKPRLWMRILDRHGRPDGWLTADRLDISQPTQEAAA